MTIILRVLFFSGIVISGLAYFLSFTNTIEPKANTEKPKPLPVSKVELAKPPPPKSAPRKVTKSQTLEKPSALTSVPFAGLKAFGSGSNGSGFISQESQNASATNSFSNSKSTQTSPVQVISSTEPVFPEQAKRKNLTGFVRLLITVDQSANVKSVEVIESNPEGIFENAAIDSIRNWKFAAAYQNGSPVEASLKRKIEFQLE